MTTICGLCHRGKVWLGGDSAVSLGKGRVEICPDPKVWVRGGVVFGAAGDVRGLQLVRGGGVSAMLTMRNWMFIEQYSALRERLLEQFNLRAIGDFDRGAFADAPDEVVSVAVSAFGRISSH